MSGCPATDCPSANPCSGKYVACTGGSVTRINIDDRSLRGSLSNNVTLLTGLTTLYFTAMDFAGSTIPSAIGQLTALTRLGLHKSSMVGTLPSSLFQLTRLEYLRLSGNAWTGTLSPLIGQLSKLTELYLGDGQLTGTLPNELSKLTALVSLFLGDQGFTSTIPAGLAALSKLQTVYLSQNLLVGVVPNIVAGTCVVQEPNDSNCLSCAGVTGCACSTSACVPRTTSPVSTPRPTPAPTPRPTPAPSPAPQASASAPRTAAPSSATGTQTVATTVTNEPLSVSTTETALLETSSDATEAAPSNQDWGLIGGVIGGAAALVVILIVVCLLVRRSRDPDDVVRGSQKTFRTPRQSTPRSSSAISISSEYGNLQLKKNSDTIPGCDTGTLTQQTVVPVAGERQVYQYAASGGGYQVGDLPANKSQVSAIRTLL